MAEDVLEKLSTVIGRKVSPVASGRKPTYVAGENVRGLRQPGNIDITNRPVVPNPSAGPGQSSTVLSMGIESDGKHVLIPMVSDGADGKPPHIMGKEEAIGYYRKTGKHLGIFDSDADADNYGRNILHPQQATLQNNNGRAQSAAPDLSTIIGRQVQPEKVSPLAMSRYQLYSKARTNGFDASGAIKTAMSTAGVAGGPGTVMTPEAIKALAAKPQTGEEAQSAWERAKTSMGEAVQSLADKTPFGANVREAGRMLGRLNEMRKHPLGMSDKEWEDHQKARDEFFTNVLEPAMDVVAAQARIPGASILSTGPAKGAAEHTAAFVEEMMSPDQIALLAGTVGESALVQGGRAILGEGVAPVARGLSKLIQVQFAAQMVQGTGEAAKASFKAATSGNWKEATGYAVDGLISGLMAKGIISHEMATSEVRRDLEKTAREKYGAPEGNAVTAAINSRFDQLDPYRQGLVIDETVRNSKQYQDVIKDVDGKNAKATARTKKQQEGRLNDYYSHAMSQAWDENVAKRTMRGLQRGREAGVRMDVESRIRQQEEHVREQQAITESLAQMQRDFEKQAAAKMRTVRRQEAAGERTELGKVSEVIADKRDDIAKQREEFGAFEPSPTAPRRTIEAVVTPEGQVAYPAMFWGEENHFAVAGDVTGHSVYRQTPRGVEWLDNTGNFSESPASLYSAGTPDEADTMARLAALTTESMSRAEEEGGEESVRDADELSAIFRDYSEGTIDAREARKRAGIAETTKLPDQYTAARDGRLNGPFHDSSAKGFYDGLREEAKAVGLSDEDTDTLLNQSGMLARQSTENNLHHVGRPGDYIVSKRGVRWTLDSKGVLHSDEGGAVPLMRRGLYSNDAVQLAQSGRVGYGTQTRDQRRASDARRRQTEEDIRKNQDQVDQEMRMAVQREGIVPAAVNEPRPDNVDKAVRQARFMSRPPKPPESQVGAIVRMVLTAPTDAKSVINAIAARNGVSPQEVMRLQLANDPARNNAPESKVARLEIGDSITDDFRKDRPWKVEQGKDGKLYLRSGNASPLLLDRLNPSDRVKTLVNKGKVTQAKLNFTEAEVNQAAFERPHYINDQERLAEGVRERMEGKQEDPDPWNEKEAERQAQQSERRIEAATAVATRQLEKALDPEPGTPLAEAEAAVDDAQQAIKVAEAAADQGAKAKARAVPEDVFPEKAPVTLGYRSPQQSSVIQNGREVPVHYEVVPLGSLVASHQWNGALMEINPDFPESLQPRTISDSESHENDLRAEADRRETDNGKSVGYDFREYADKTQNGSMGPAIVDPRGFIAGGNTRISIMRRHLDNLNTIGDPELREAKIEGFKAAMRKLAADVGVPGFPNDDGFNVVVRVLDKPIESTREATDLGNLFNSSISVKIRESARGISYARNMTPELLEDIGRRTEAYDGLNAAMMSDPEFFRKIVTDKFGVPKEEFADWFDDIPGRGLILNDSGKSKFSKVMLGTVIKDSALLNRIEGKTAYRAVERALPWLIKIQALPERDITAKITEALNASAEVMNTDPGLSNSNDRWLATYHPDQQGFLGMEVLPSEPDRMTEVLWRALTASDAATPRTFNDRIKSFIGEESSLAGLIFEEQKETPAQAFNRAFSKELKETAFSRKDKNDAISEEEYEAALRNRELSDAEKLDAENPESTEGGRGQSPERAGGVETSPPAKIYEELTSGQKQAISDYVDDVGPPWDEKASKFNSATVSLVDLEKAHRRPLKLSTVDRGMVGKSRTEGPLLLDSDLSVIDGMHRIATAIQEGKDSLSALVRVSADTYSREESPAQFATSIEDVIRDGIGNAEVAARGVKIPELRKAFEDLGWTWHEEQKELEKGGWVVWFRSQGETSGVIAQWHQQGIPKKGLEKGFPRQKNAPAPPGPPSSMELPPEPKTAKEPYEMSHQEFAKTPGIDSVPKSSLLAMGDSEYTQENLGRFSVKQLKPLAMMWGVAKNGTREEIVSRILERLNLRTKLASETVDNLLQKPGTELRQLVKETGIFGGGTKETMAKGIVAWRDGQRTGAVKRLAEAKHQLVIEQALAEGKTVPEENLRRYRLGKFENYDERDELARLVRQGMTKPPEPPTKASIAARDMANEKAEKGYVTPEKLQEFLEAHPATKDSAPTLMRTAKLMAEYVFDADPPEGVDRKDALGWVLKERLAGIEAGELKNKRGQYSDPLIEKGVGDGIMKLHKAADPSTFIHEFSHVIFPMLSDEDLKAIDTIQGPRGKGAWDGTRASLTKDVYAELSEKLANGVESFLRDENPTGFTHEVKAVLAKVKEIMRKVYLAFAKDPLSDFEPTEEAREVFSKMFGIADFDVKDDWRAEMKKARAEDKRMKMPEETLHPIQKVASDAGAIGIRDTITGRVEDSAGERLDPRKPTTVLIFPSEEKAAAFWADVISGRGKVTAAELIQTEDGGWAVRMNTKVKVPRDVLYQGLPSQTLHSEERQYPAGDAQKRELLKTEEQRIQQEMKKLDLDSDAWMQIATDWRKYNATERAQAWDEKGKARDAWWKNQKQLREVQADLKKIGEPKLGELRQDSSGRKTLWLTKDPMWMVQYSLSPGLGNAFKQLHGVSIDAKDVEDLKKRIDTYFTSNPIREQVKRLLDEAKARAGKDGVTIVGAKGRGLSETAKTAREEMNHAWQREVSADGQVGSHLTPDKFADLATLVPDSANEYLTKHGYAEDPVTRVVETAAKIMSGAGEEMGVHPMEEAYFLSEYFQSVIDQHGPEAFNTLKRVMGTAKRFREEITSGKSGEEDRFVLSKRQSIEDDLGRESEGGAEGGGKRSRWWPPKIFGSQERVEPGDESTLYQNVPQKHPGLELEETKKRLAETPASAPMVRKLLQLKIQNLENEIRSRYGAETTPVVEKPAEIAAAARKEIKNANPNNVRKEADGESRVHEPERPRGFSAPPRPPEPKNAGANRAGGVRQAGSGVAGARVPASLAQVPAVGIQPLAIERGAAVGTTAGETFNQDAWKRSLTTAGLPDNLPPPTWALNRKTAEKLIFPGQKEVVQTALSALEQGDGFVGATATGTGKTYTGMAIIKEWRDRHPDARVLYITKNQKLLRNARGVSENTFGFEMEKKLPDRDAPTGVYGMSYMGMIADPKAENTHWDLVIADESGEARNWFKEDNQQGKRLMAVTANADKVAYFSATPFHSPMEYGYMTKLNLWPRNGFDKWIEQNFAHEKIDGKVIARLDPAKQAKLRQQLIERGQLVSQAISYDGFTAHFGVVPVTDSMKRGLDRIHEGFSRAKAQLIAMKRKGLAEKIAAFEATYTKAYLERERLPQAIEIAQRARRNGWQVMLFSETSSEDLFRRTREAGEEVSTYQELDDAMGGQLSRIIPPFPNIYEKLKEAFGEQIGDYSGRGNSMGEREKALTDYLTGERPMIYSTYAAGGIGVSLHDADYPELGITGGERPRVSVFLGPPYSGVLLEQAMGRSWRFGVKSDTHSVFLATDSEPDVRLMQMKVGPRMKALRASVLGEKDSLANVMATYTDEEKTRERQEALAYQEGNEPELNAQNFQVRSRSRNVGINDWSLINFPPADTAKNKGMKYGEHVAGGDWSNLYQSKMGMLFPDTPEQSSGKETVDSIGNGLTSGAGVPPGTSVQNLDPSDRDVVVGAAASVATDAVDVSQDRDAKAAARQAMQSQMQLPGDKNKWILTFPNKRGKIGVWKYTGDPEDLKRTPVGDEPVRQKDIRTWYGGFSFTQEIGIQSISRRAGAGEAGDNIVRMNRSYQADADVNFADFAMTAVDIAKKYKLDTNDPQTMNDLWDAVEGKRVVANPDINSAVEEIADLHERIHSAEGSAGVKLKTPSGEVLSWRQISKDRNYMPHRIDWDAKVQDPLTGETHILRDIMKETFAEAKRRRIIEAISRDRGYTYDQVVDYLHAYSPNTPVLSHIHRARSLDFPFIKKDWRTLMGYYRQAADAIAIEKNFGSDRGKLEKEISRIPSENGRKTIKSMFDGLLEPQEWQDWTAKVYNNAITFEAISKMTISVTKVPFHLVHIPMGLKGRVMPMVKAIARDIFHHKDVMDNATYVGTIARQLNAADVIAGRDDSQGLASQGLTHLYFRISGFNAAYKQVRAIAGESSRIWMEQYAMRELKKGNQEEARRILRDVMLIGDKAIDEAIANGRFSPEDLAKGQTGFANLVAWSNNPLQMPGWARIHIEKNEATTTVGLKRAVRLTYALQSFSLKSTSLLREQLYDEVVHHKNFKPLAYAIVAYPIIGQMLGATGAAAKGFVHHGIEGLEGKKHEQDSWDKFLANLEDTFEHPEAVKFLKFYIDGWTLGVGWDRVRRWTSPFLNAAIGKNKEAQSGLTYLLKDEGEQLAGPAFSDLIELMSYGVDVGKIELGEKHPEQKGAKVEAATKKEVKQIVPIVGQVPGFTNPPKVKTVRPHY